MGWWPLIKRCSPNPAWTSSWVPPASSRLVPSRSKLARRTPVAPRNRCRDQHWDDAGHTRSDWHHRVEGMDVGDDLAAGTVAAATDRFGWWIRRLRVRFDVRALRHSGDIATWAGSAASS